MKPRPNPRGQTLVVFALTMLLMVLLVCMTLAIGMKTKEKMEVQALADAAAYSNAAVTARVYNQMALMNRAQIGHMVSMAGVQSLISWSSIYRANAGAIIRNYGYINTIYSWMAVVCCLPKSPCKHLCKCSRTAAKETRASRKHASSQAQQIFKDWDQLDKAAAEQVRLLEFAAARIYLLGQMPEYVRLLMELDGKGQAKDVVNKSGVGRGVMASSATQWVNLREAWVPGTGAINPIPLLNQHHVWAAMGSRGFTFTTSRSIATFILKGHLDANFMDAKGEDPLLVNNQGSAYFAASQNHGKLMATSRYSWADDHGGNLVVHNRARPPCPKLAWYTSTTAVVQSTDKSDANDRHRWSPTAGGPGDMEPAITRHTFADKCNPRLPWCPGMWPIFFDYNPIRLVWQSDNWGQPKNFAVVQRDYGSGRADPWNLFFRFRFTPEGSTFDNRGVVLADGTNISRQTGLSAGIAYYHRRQAWREPPNLLNPYWRATLVPLTVDRDGEDDVSSTLNKAGVGWSAQAWRALRQAGYEGGP